jgi:cell division protein FtsB
MTARAQAARGYRMRPAPRSRRSGVASRIRWDRFGRIALVIVIGLVLVSYVNPIVNFVDAWNDSRNEHAQLADLRKENEQLRQRLAGLDGPGAAERGARKLGMVAPGERSFVIKSDR